MCGIAGYFGFSATGGDAEVIAAAMADRIRHRGPDGGGVWLDADCEIALAHRRLAILDLSEAGRQPMVSAAGGYVIVFNGEIYNHQELRNELELVRPDVAWRGHSDTETLLAGFDAWGIDATVSRAAGMFAFAVWDRQTRKLTLGRDRFGEKPLYYGWSGHTFLFASELKAIKAHPAFHAEIDRKAVALQLSLGCVPAPHSIYRGFYKLQPGALLSVGRSDCVTPDCVTPRFYWRFADVVRDGRANPFSGDETEAAAELERLLRRAIGQQMVADVPLGAFLSGGVDSSLVVALMQAQSSQAVKTFTIGFNEPGYNEAEYAAEIASRLHTEHTELYVSAQQAMDVIPQLPAIYDEPFSDSSQIPTFLVAKLARQHVTVSLSGDGGDELFGGYRRYSATQNHWPRISALPRPVRRALAAALEALPSAPVNRAGEFVERAAPSRGKWHGLGDNALKLSRVLRADGANSLYRQFVTDWTDEERPVLGVDNARPPPSEFDLDDPVEQMMAMDATSYLPDDILHKVDRAAMAVSLETRVPMLDHRVAEFAWTLPLGRKVRDGQGKRILRDILYQYVPQSLIERPKKGFAVPIDSWLRGLLRGWAEDLLDEARLRRDGIFDAEPIRRKWHEHLSGSRNWQNELWDVLMFQAWLRNDS